MAGITDQTIKTYFADLRYLTRRQHVRNRELTEYMRLSVAPAVLIACTGRLTVLAEWPPGIAKKERVVTSV